MAIVNWHLLFRRAKFAVMLLFFFISIVLVVNVMHRTFGGRYAKKFAISRDGNMPYERFKLVGVEDSPVKRILSPISTNVSLHGHNAHLARFEPKCTHFTCFDVSRCDVVARKFINVYTYPVRQYLDTNGRSMAPSFSDEYFEMLKAITSSPYHTNDPREACLFIPSIDLLNLKSSEVKPVSSVLTSLKFWDIYGRNHLLFNMKLPPQTVNGANVYFNAHSGHAMVAGGSFDSWNFRTEFDVSIPVIPPKFSFLKPNNSTKRKWLLMSPKESDDLTSLEDGNMDDVIVLSTKCPAKENELAASDRRWRCNKLRNEDDLDYAKVMQESKFCLIPSSSPNTYLVESLMTGCIPVLSLNDDVVLPFEEKIIWKDAAIFYRHDKLSSILDLLRHKLISSKMDMMTKYGTFVFEHYLKSMSRIALTTLDIINGRLISHSPKDDHKKLLCPESDSPKE